MHLLPQAAYSYTLSDEPFYNCVPFLFLVFFNLFQHMQHSQASPGSTDQDFLHQSAGPLSDAFIFIECVALKSAQMISLFEFHTGLLYSNYKLRPHMQNT